MKLFEVLDFQFKLLRLYIKLWGYVSRSSTELIPKKIDGKVQALPVKILESQSVVLPFQKRFVTVIAT